MITPSHWQPYSHVPLPSHGCERVGTDALEDASLMAVAHPLPQHSSPHSARELLLQCSDVVGCAADAVHSALSLATPPATPDPRPPVRLSPGLQGGSQVRLRRSHSETHLQNGLVGTAQAVSSGGLGGRGTAMLVQNPRVPRHLASPASPPPKAQPNFPP